MCIQWLGFAVCCSLCVCFDDKTCCAITSFSFVRVREREREIDF